MPKLLRTSEKILFVLHFFNHLPIFSFTSSRRVRNHLQQGLYRLIRLNLVEKGAFAPDSDLRLTSRGKNQLFRLFPNLNFRPYRRWDGRWRLASFDVGESHRKIRGLLRHLLSGLGFALLQESLYLSPQPVEGELKSYLINTGLDRFVHVFISQSLGTDTAMAGRLWQLPDLNGKYQTLLNEFAMNGSLPLLRAGFLEVASQDPYLPLELLPQDWLGQKVEEKVLSN